MAVDAGDDEEVSPGRLTRMAVVEPPYWARRNAGEHDQARQPVRDESERGNSIAMVAIGPMPGSTPIKVPISAPYQASEIGGSARTAKPQRKIVDELHHHTGQTGIVKPSPRMKLHRRAR